MRVLFSSIVLIMPWGTSQLFKSENFLHTRILRQVERLIYESWRSAKLDLSRCSLTELDTRACEVIYGAIEDARLCNMIDGHRRLKA